MGRKSKRRERRQQLIDALGRVLAKRGSAEVSIAQVAHEADVAPALVHHNFENKRELFESLFDQELARLDAQAAQARKSESPLMAYADAMLSLEKRADTQSARVWVRLFAEALKDSRLEAKLKRALDREIMRVQRLSNERLNTEQASALVAFVIGALVFGAFAPKRTRGFAATQMKVFIKSLDAR